MGGVAGGLGLIGCGYGDSRLGYGGREWISEQFAATEEALGSVAMKRRLVGASGDDTVRTGVFDIVRGLDWPEPYTGRALANAFTARWHGRERELAARLPEEVERYEAAREAGDLDTAVLFAGEGLDLIASCSPAAEVVAAMVEEAERLIRDRRAP